MKVKVQIVRSHKETTMEKTIAENLQKEGLVRILEVEKPDVVKGKEK